MENLRIERACVFVIACALAFTPSTVWTQPSEVSSARELSPREAADAAFNRGTTLAAEAKWAEALASFELAHGFVPHAITLYNIGACERALGRYTAARRTLQTALVVDREGITLLPQRLREDAAAFLTELDALIVRVPVDIATPDVLLAVDGRPLYVMTDASEGAGEVLVAGLSSPGRGARIPGSFTLEIDPGRHVLVFSREGHTDGILTRDFASGTAPPLRIELDELPALIEVSADQPGALVTIDGRDQGPVPVSILRPAGAYRVVVEKDGFVTAETSIEVRAGEETSFRATLPIDAPSVLETWWFWTLTGSALVGVGVGTYFLARSEPEPVRATIGGGTLGWRVPLP